MTPGTGPDTPDFEYLLRAYFHQDFDIYGSDTSAILDFFAAEEPDIVPGARDGAAELLARDLSEEDLDVALDEAGLTDFRPEGEGLTKRQWLELVVRHLTELLGRRKP